MTIWKFIVRELVDHGQIITIICLILSQGFKLIICSKLKYHVFRHLIPIFSMCIGILLMFVLPYIRPDFHDLYCRIVFGSIFGLSATGICEAFKRIKRFIKTMKYHNDRTM